MWRSKMSTGIRLGFVAAALGYTLYRVFSRKNNAYDGEIIDGSFF